MRCGLACLAIHCLLGSSSMAELWSCARVRARSCHCGGVGGTSANTDVHGIPGGKYPLLFLVAVTGAAVCYSLRQENYGSITLTRSPKGQCKRASPVAALVRMVLWGAAYKPIKISHASTGGAVAQRRRDPAWCATAAYDNTRGATGRRFVRSWDGPCPRRDSP